MKNFAATSIILLTLLFLCGCSDQMKYDSAFVAGESLYEMEQKVLTESLFKEDQAVISNNTIDQILSSKIIIPAGSKLSILRFEYNYRWAFWSAELMKADQQAMNQFIDKIKTSKRLSEAMYLPSMIITRNMTVSQMRSAAARTQSNLLLVYKTTLQNFEKDRFIGKKEAKACSTVEAILIDVRTGIIPYSTIATETFTATKNEQDINFQETTMRAQQEATNKALSKIADDVVKYLDNLS